MQSFLWSEAPLMRNYYHTRMQLHNARMQLHNASMQLHELMLLRNTLMLYTTRSCCAQHAHAAPNVSITQPSAAYYLVACTQYV